MDEKKSWDRFSPFKPLQLLKSDSHTQCQFFKNVKERERERENKIEQPEQMKQNHQITKRHSLIEHA